MRRLTILFDGNLTQNMHQDKKTIFIFLRAHLLVFFLLLIKFGSRLNNLPHTIYYGFFFFNKLHTSVVILMKDKVFFLLSHPILFPTNNLFCSSVVFIQIEENIRFRHLRKIFFFYYLFRHKF